MTISCRECERRVRVRRRTIRLCGECIEGVLPRALLTDAEQTYIRDEDRRNRQRATFKNGRRQLRCTSCGCWRAKAREDGHPPCRNCGNADLPRAEVVYPRPENTPTWPTFLLRFVEECHADIERAAERDADPDPIPF